MEHIEDIKGIEKESLSLFIKESLGKLAPARKVLVLIPDYSRVDFSHLIAPAIIDRYKGSHIDFLSAGGTHRPMESFEFEAKLGIGPSENIAFLNHAFKDKDSLTTIGKIERKLISDKTQGMMDTGIDITVNKLIFSGYDIIIALSATLPHEAAGYSGGLKIFFPGISGPQVIDAFHWAAVLVGIPDIIGTVDNNCRDIINAGSEKIFSKIGCPVYSFNMVNTEADGKALPVGLYIGKGYKGFKEAYGKATSASKKVHIKYIDKPLSKVVQVIPQSYDEVWLAGKGSYKLQRPGVLKKGAEVIIYAPHIDCFHNSSDIEADLLSLGYHCRDHICSLIDKGSSVSKNAASHLINVCGPGVFDPHTKKEKLDIKVTLATAIPKDKVERAGLSYRDPATIKKADYMSPDKLWIEDGGKYLYELKKG